MPEAKLELGLSFSLEFYFSKQGLDAIKMSTWWSKCHHFKEIIFNSSLTPPPTPKEREKNQTYPQERPFHTRPAAEPTEGDTGHLTFVLKWVTQDETWWSSGSVTPHERFQAGSSTDLSLLIWMNGGIIHLSEPREKWTAPCVFNCSLRIWFQRPATGVGGEGGGWAVEWPHLSGDSSLS